MPSVKLEDAGVRLGAIEGYRLWRVFDGYALHSVSVTHKRWLPGEPMTGDPDAAGREGVYAFKEPLEAVRNFEFNRYATSVIWGKVKLWGRYVEHVRGYRAEFAKIVELIDGSHDVDLNAVRSLYLDLRVPDGLIRVVDRSGRVVGVTTARTEPRGGHWNSYLGRHVEGDRPPLYVQTHHWSGRDLLLEDGQDPTWVPGWLPLPQPSKNAV